MRFRRSEGIPIPRKEEKPVGRPTGWRKEDGVFTTIRVNHDTKAMLGYEHKEGERYNDTLMRMFYERAQTIQKLRQNNDSLKLENERLKLENERLKVEHSTIETVSNRTY
jgi:hypothetical protein